jgi:hypothetical protein
MAQALPAPGFARFGEAVEEGVGSGIVRLTGIAGDAGDRRIEDKEIERRIADSFVQRHRARHLGREDGGNLFRRLVRKSSVPHHTGGVNDAVKPAIVPPDHFDQLRNGAFVGEIDTRVMQTRFGLQPGRSFRVRIVTAGEDDCRARSLFQDVLGQMPTELSGAAGDQVDPARPPWDGRRSGSRLDLTPDFRRQAVTVRLQMRAGRGIGRVAQQPDKRIRIRSRANGENLTADLRMLAMQAAQHGAKAAERFRSLAFRQDKLESGRTVVQ